MLDTLRRLTQALNNTTDLDTGLAVVVHGVKTQLAVDACSVYLVDASDTGFVLVATDGFDPRAVGSVRFARGEGLVGLVVERQRPISLSNAQDHPRFRHLPQFGEQVHHAFLGVPITHLRQPLGALIVRQLNDRVFGRDEQAFLLAIAGELAGLAHAGSSRGAQGFSADRKRAPPALLRGIKGAPGIGIGTCVLPSAAAAFDTVPDLRAEGAQAEALAFQRAVAAVRAELILSAQRLAAGVPTETHAMFGVYVELLDDDELFADTLERIRAGESGAAALRETITLHARVFEEMADPYLRARAEDLRGLGRRVLLHLQSGMTEPRIYPERCVLVGEEVSIARIADVPVAQLAGIVCSRGSPYSHAAILARTLRIPAVMGLGKVPLEPLAGRRLLVDGTHGRVYVDPPPDVVADFERVSAQQHASADKLAALRELPAQTPDGARVALQANVGLSSDLATALDSGAEGIGLFRTEFSFMVRDSFPSEDEQVRVYREILARFAPRPVTMRTLDVGGDKGLPYFPLQEENAFLGWRGIRLTLDNPGIFLTQLRALLRANAGMGNLKVLLPMISSAREVDAVRELLVRAAAECESAGHPTQAVELGAMIEVPSAIFQMAALARRVDFFSIGTNDLTQYLLAVDRSNARVARHFDSLHPAVLRAIDSTARGALDAWRPLSVCGEMAGDPQAAVLLMGLGVETLSMAAASIPAVKLALRTFSRQRAQAMAVLALAAEDPLEVRQMLNAAFDDAGLKSPAAESEVR
ncbi:MAG: phosphoenolpyruvate--protein phosphotransferase [Rubrivivax sp.]|nr:phosphoenolpyruvate--protein phosphotransferase [Rubrivivax sp.]